MPDWYSYFCFLFLCRFLSVIIAVFSIHTIIVFIKECKRGVFRNKADMVSAGLHIAFYHTLYWTILMFGLCLCGFSNFYRVVVSTLGIGLVFRMTSSVLRFVSISRNGTLEDKASTKKAAKSYIYAWCMVWVLYTLLFLFTRRGYLELTVSEFTAWLWNDAFQIDILSII